MKNRKFRTLAALAGAAMLTPSLAAATSHQTGLADRFVCATQTLLECRADGTCERVTHETANAPSILRVDTAEKLVSGLRPDGIRRMTEIRDVRVIGDQLVLQGSDVSESEGVGTVGWSMSVEAATGRMAVSIVSQDVVLVIYGDCEAL